MGILEGMERIIHTIAPVYDSASRVLILGTIPSPKSREQGFFYGHPQNRFWRVLSLVMGTTLPITIEEKRNMLLKTGIALWDVLHSCEIAGASDSSIKNPVPNDFSVLFQTASIGAVFTTGQTATKLYQKLTGNSSIYLPSTSPANCALSLEAMVTAYSSILEYL